MKVLITNSFLDGYTGSEVVVRDLSLELKRQGHQPMVYAPRLGSISDEIRSRGVEVTDKLSRLGTVPDVIHGQQHYPTSEAMVHFPSVPVIYVCHSAIAPLDEPFYFPRILRYVAVDDLCRKRIETRPDIPPARIEVIWNAVDLNRFQPRGVLPLEPRRGLVFSNAANGSTHLPAVLKACRKTGLQLDVVGAAAGTAVPNPEAVLPRYDIVFAKARCALEAMAAGCAVVLCDSAGAGPLVTSGNFDVLRRMNFGRGVLTNPLKSGFISGEVERYNPSDAAEVSGRVRGEAGLTEAVHCWVQLYAEVIDEFRDSGSDCAAELRALAAYIGHLRNRSYERRMEWEIEQFRKVKKIPLVGSSLFSLGRWALKKWTQS